jgi:hypothetical protein
MHISHLLQINLCHTTELLALIFITSEQFHHRSKVDEISYIYTDIDPIQQMYTILICSDFVVILNIINDKCPVVDNLTKSSNIVNILSIVTKRFCE